ncbi:hypothetical protein [Streptomyces albipurpureus]|nr:hypothetical protein [Streptomyces sp. CWNU-1]
MLDDAGDDTAFLALGEEALLDNIWTVFVLGSLGLQIGGARTRS